MWGRRAGPTPGDWHAHQRRTARLGRSPSAIDWHRDRNALVRFQRAVSRKRTGSQNHLTAARRLARFPRRVAQQRANTLHHLTSRLAKTKSVVVPEDRNVAGMLRNQRLAQAIGDVGCAEFRRQRTYKAAWYGCVWLPRGGGQPVGPITHNVFPLRLAG